MARVGEVVRAGRRQGGGVGGCSSGAVCEIDIVSSEFSERRRAHTHTLFKYSLGKPLEAKRLKEILGKPLEAKRLKEILYASEGTAA